MRRSLQQTATETLSYLEQGGFQTNHGDWVDFSEAQRAAVAGTFTLTPEAGAELLNTSGTGGSSPSVMVTRERTQEAARRLVEDELWRDLVALNFASARSPGGGFMRGARAQEEDLARCSGLYPCLLSQPNYYEGNRVQRSLIYRDHLIYSPQVPWFRGNDDALLDRYFSASIITAPAPNAGEVLRRDPSAGPCVEAALHHRAGLILALARAQKHRSLLLGAWGCGVFKNDPTRVAESFKIWLTSNTFAGDFDRVCFAIFDRGGEILNAFRAEFS